MMKRCAFALMLSLCAGAAAAQEKVEWPNYSTAPWVAADQEPFVIEVHIPVKNNKYVVSPAQYLVAIGTVTFFLDNVDNPTLQVMEGSVLDSGPVIRTLAMRNIGQLSLQLKVNGEWKDAPPPGPGLRLVIELMDPDRLIQKGDMKGVVLRVLDGKKEVMRTVVENKPAKIKSAR